MPACARNAGTASHCRRAMMARIALLTQASSSMTRIRVVVLAERRIPLLSCGFNAAIERPHAGRRYDGLLGNIALRHASIWHQARSNDANGPHAIHELTS